ncbi:CPBP family intramembrane metalloprotease [Bacillus sp. AGMB 02131]|uniref:CPBP family intramembrane metalloprotease n=1 Tax=Peribacillus faecalis TaxID=2772559 RepID=A0A927HC32_9BACI|nr:CPBP family intramembrane glutamic endopeptidase [Peribacillus faecalis]MBD3109146.1 CPBP family intramembrane metalloprotease [Peribacillus faecalis]
MKKQYIYVLLTYILMQLSSLIGMPPIYLYLIKKGYSSADAELFATGYWGIFSFSAALLIILLILRKELFINEPLLRTELPRASASLAAFWAIAGIFLAFFAQSIAGMIEAAIGIETGSENTQFLVSVIDKMPLFIITTSIIAPVLEEIVFRKIIFGAIYKRWNFFISALLSSLIFGLVHFEFEHILLYTAMGFTFAFLYAKTQRIFVPIAAHVMMNTLVVIAQFVYRDDINEMINSMEQVQSFIGGFL